MDQILPLGPKPMMNDEELKTISALCSFIAIGQINGELEKSNDLIACIKPLLKGKQVYNELTLY
jgi:hypothetical protein